MQSGKHVGQNLSQLVVIEKCDVRTSEVYCQTIWFTTLNNFAPTTLLQPDFNNLWHLGVLYKNNILPFRIWSANSKTQLTIYLSQPKLYTVT